MGHGIPNIFTETKQVEQERKGVTMRTISLQKECGSDLAHTATTHRLPLSSCLQVFSRNQFQPSSECSTFSSSLY